MSDKQGKSGDSLNLEHNLIDGEVYTGDISFEKLYNWNKYAGILHAVQGTLILILSLVVGNIRDFKTPLTRVFLTRERDEFGEQIEDGSLEISEPVEFWSLPIGSMAALFILLSAAAHFIIISPYYWPTYQKEINMGMNTARWYEYAISSSVMIVLIACLFGCYDIATILCIVGCNASMNLFGLMMELLNYYTPKDVTLWSPFWFGCFSGVFAWIVTFIYLFGSDQRGDIPSFVYAILFVYIFFFNTFPINMYLQYAKYGKWADYRYGELWYVFQSLISKSILAWIVVAGTGQPSDDE
jgi:hypothetical protein